MLCSVSLGELLRKQKEGGDTLPAGVEKVKSIHLAQESLSSFINPLKT